MKRAWILFTFFTAILITACNGTVTPTPQSSPGATAEVLTLTATKDYSPSTSYSDGTSPISANTIITLPTSIGVTSGDSGTAGNRVALSFDGGTVDNLVGIRCYYANTGPGTAYAFSSCDGGAGGPGVLPYYNGGDAVTLTAGDTLVLRVMSGDNSTPTTASVSIAGILQN